MGEGRGTVQGTQTSWVYEEEESWAWGPEVLAVGRPGPGVLALGDERS